MPQRMKARQDRAVRVDARQVGGALAVADGVDGAAEGRAGEEQDDEAETASQTRSATGIEAMRPTARYCITGVAAVCGAKPPVCATMSPRITALTPRVKIIEGTRR